MIDDAAILSPAHPTEIPVSWSLLTRAIKTIHSLSESRKRCGTIGDNTNLRWNYVVRFFYAGTFSIDWILRPTCIFNQWDHLGSLSVLLASPQNCFLLLLSRLFVKLWFSNIGLHITMSPTARRPVISARLDQESCCIVIVINRFVDIGETLESSILC